jgi:hypothetical protein
MAALALHVGCMPLSNYRKGLLFSRYADLAPVMLVSVGKWCWSICSKKNYKQTPTTNSSNILETKKELHVLLK